MNLNVERCRLFQGRTFSSLEVSEKIHFLLILIATLPLLFPLLKQFWMLKFFLFFFFGFPNTTVSFVCAFPSARKLQQLNFGIDLYEIQYSQDWFNAITTYEVARSHNIRWEGRGFGVANMLVLFQILCETYFLCKLLQTSLLCQFRNIPR